jgi:hypothetical protein
MPITTTPSGGPQGEFSTYTPIYATTLSASAASVTFSNIPQNYTDLRLVVNGLQTGTSGNPYIVLNEDSLSKYSITRMSGNGTAATSARSSRVNFMYIGIIAEVRNTMLYMGKVDLMGYSNNLTFKPVLIRSDNASFGTDAIVGTLNNIGPITSLTIDLDAGNWNTGSTFTLYGIKAAETATLITPQALGGKISQDASYIYHTFLASDVFTPLKSLTCDVLTIGGGGSGSGVYVGGGGGSGGAVYSTGGTLTATQYPVLIGAGGAALGLSTDGGNNGSNTTFGSVLTANGGGFGGRFNDGAGRSGGSGGGGGTGSGGSATQGSGTLGTRTLYGNNGGSGTTNASGGGGGIGAVGSNQSGGSYGGPGGAGLNTWSSWATATGTGVDGYYGGGGTGCNANGVGGGGGDVSALGGGGRQGVSGVGNTGSGGGGTREAGYKGNGGSGIVIVRYAK